ncbi:MAG: glutamate--tRNA ligase [Methylococcaceae bacterium]|nr:glutamate--tRNA ligase [Methylococcaceae bacterium]
MNPCKTRFAPSPTGLMHLGNARTALFSALLGDRFLLRIEDTDAERSRSEFVSELLADLRWLGLLWDEGPLSAEPGPDYFQSWRGDVYRRYYEQLERDGLAYPCFCSASELEIARKVQLASGQPPRYGGKCAGLSAVEVATKRDQGLAPTLRFRVAKGETVAFEDGVRGAQKFASADIGDFIIRRADGSPAFFFCNAIDDSVMGVDLVLRGEDHLANTPRQLLLLQALGLPAPRYAHMSLILGDDGAPLSKRNGSRSISQLREQGYLPLAVLNMLARIGHHYDNESILPLTRLKAEFNIAHLGRSPSRFDPAHLNHWQEEAVRHSDPDGLRQWLWDETWAVVPQERSADFLELVRSNCLFPADADRWARILFTDELVLEPEVEAAVRQAGEGFFGTAADALRAAPDFDGFLAAVKTRTGTKGKQLFMPLRGAWTGRFDGPELARIHQIMDPYRLRKRLEEYAPG